MGNAHSGETVCGQHRLGLFHDDFRIVTYPPQRSTPVEKSDKDGSSRRSRKSTRDKDDEAGVCDPYEKEFDTGKRTSSARASPTKKFDFH